MSGFDAYYKWLGISPEEQPANIYRLLGVRKFETDLDVISNAADQRMISLRTYATGPHGSLAENLLNQIASARLCLLDSKRKAAYDQALKASGGGAASAPAAPGAPPKAAAPPPPPVTSADGDQGALFGQYVLFERMGGGRSGPIYRAKHRQTGQWVSLKILPASAAQTPQLLKRFEREVAITTSLNHPNLICARAAGEQDGIHFLVMEHIDAQDLATVVQQHGPLDVNRAVNYTMQAAAGLAHLHSQGVYHRNIKPQNILVDGQGVIKIANLTLARLDENSSVDNGQEGLTQTGEMMGSVDYLAPEQAADASRADQRADVYSLGCTFYHLLMGRPPYTGKSLVDKLVAHRAQPIPSLSALRPDVPPQVDKVFNKMMAKKVEERFNTMHDVLTAFNPKAAPAAPASAPKPPAAPTPPAAPAAGAPMGSGIGRAGAPMPSGIGRAGAPIPTNPQPAHSANAPVPLEPAQPAAGGANTSQQLVYALVGVIALLFILLLVVLFK